MKNLVLIVHAGLKQATADLLRSLDDVEEFTFTDVEGHGNQDDYPDLSNRDKVVGYVPRLRVDIILDDSKVDSVLAVFQEKREGGKSNGKQNIYWVLDIHKNGEF